MCIADKAVTRDLIGVKMAYDVINRTQLNSSGIFLQKSSMVKNYVHFRSVLGNIFPSLKKNVFVRKVENIMKNVYFIGIFYLSCLLTGNMKIIYYVVESMK